MVEVGRDIEVKTPWSWRILAVTQLIALAGVVVALLWFLALWMGPANLLVGTVDVPVLGPVPAPLALLVVSVVVSLLIGGLARLDAGWRGKRAVRSVERALRESVDREIGQYGFARLTEMDTARTSLAPSIRRAEQAIDREQPDREVGAVAGERPVGVERATQREGGIGYGP